MCNTIIQSTHARTVWSGQAQFVSTQRMISLALLTSLRPLPPQQCLLSV
jgi:hypothetical protein